MIRRLIFIYLLLPAILAKWEVIRNKPVGFESSQEGHDKLTSISTSETGEWYVSCGREFSANFYRVLMYPNVYPYWPHLYYGKLHLNRTLGIPICHLTSDASELIVAYQDGVQVTIERYFQRKIRSYDPNTFNVPQKVEDAIGFHIVHPRDNHGMVWTRHPVDNITVALRDEKEDVTQFWEQQSLQVQVESSSGVRVATSPNGTQLAISNTIIPLDRSWKGSVPVSHCDPSLAFLPSGHAILIEGESLIERDWIHADVMLASVPSEMRYVWATAQGCCRRKHASCPPWNHSEESILIVANDTALYVYLYPIQGPPLQVILLHPHGLVTSKVIVQFSGDGQKFAVSGVASRKCLVFTRCSSQFCLEDQILLDQDVMDLAFVYFEYYYLLIGGANNVILSKSINASVPECEDKARQGAFDLAAPPLRDLLSASDWMQYHGIFHSHSFWIINALALLVAVLLPLVSSLEQRLITAAFKLLPLAVVKRMHTLETILFLASAGGMFLFSLWEIKEQPAFVNDWPAHLHHVDQLWEGTLQYSQYMHHHGPNTYAGGFLLMYSVLYKVTGGSLPQFQMIWALLELGMYLLLYSIASQLKVPRLLAILVIFSNRLHLYNVRVVINDFPSVVIVYGSIYLLMQRYRSFESVALSCSLYSFALTTKLNFIFYAPALALLLLLTQGFYWTLVCGIVMASVQIGMGLPFLLSDPVGYLSNAYDIRRTLLWEKTRNFKFLGRDLYSSPSTNLFLLGITVVLLAAYLWKVYREWKREAPQLEIKRKMIHALFFSNYLFVAFARGLYTPFMCWYFYSFPILCYLGGLPWTYTLALWGGHEYLFRFFRNMEYEMHATYVYFLTNMLLIIFTFINYPRHLKMKKD